MKCSIKITATEVSVEYDSDGEEISLPFKPMQAEAAEVFMATLVARENTRREIVGLFLELARETRKAMEERHR